MILKHLAQESALCALRSSDFRLRNRADPAFENRAYPVRDPIRELSADSRRNVRARTCVHAQTQARAMYDTRTVLFKIQFRDFAPLDPATLDHPALSGNRVSIRFDRAGGGRRSIGRIII